MPVHDWKRVDAGIFHSFHTTWIAQINSTLNAGLLPSGYYALAEQHAGEAIADVLTLHVSDDDSPSRTRGSSNGGTLVVEAPPRVRRRDNFDNPGILRPRTLAIRHVSGHELVALIEIVSPGNKDRAAHVESFAEKAAEALNEGIHLLIIDLFPPGKFDPAGIHGAIAQAMGRSEERYNVPQDEPLTLAAYSSGSKVEAFIEPARVGVALIDMPLFLRSDRYINVPLESTYMASYAGVPAVWRDVIEGRSSASA